MKTRILFLVFAFTMIVQAKAQMECRSTLGAHLTPFKKDGATLWAIEWTMAPGIMTSPYDSLDKTNLNGGMILAALDFSFMSGKSHIYAEGGLKNWKNSNFVDNTKLTDSKHLGMRQVFYSFSNTNTKIKLGLHETRLGDFFLIDERVLGTSIDKEIGAFTLNVRGGTVNKNFARMGKFCSNRHIYGIINPDFTENIGEKVGETNFAGFAININPNYILQNKQQNTTDEFTDTNNDEFSTVDEFHINHDFSEFGSSDEFSDKDLSVSKQKISVKNIGFIIYDEFGSKKYIPENKLYSGLLVDLDLPFGLFMQTGTVYQNMSNNNTFAYIARFGKNLSWDNGSLTKVSGAYIGKYNIDDNAIFQPLFSNLYIGEVVRMDAPNFPLWQAAVKHRFAGKMKFHIAIKAVGELENKKTNEEDIEFGFLAFKKHLKITIIGSRIESLAFSNDVFMARIELRLAF